MTGRAVMATGIRPVLVLVAVLVSVAACTKHDSLVLLELRSSGPLGAPVARIRLSAQRLADPHASPAASAPKASTSAITARATARPSP